MPAFTVDAHRPLGAFDVLGRQLRHRARLHEPAHRAGPGRDPAARHRPRRAPPGRRRRWARGVQPRADRRLRRRRGDRRRRGGRRRHHRRRARLEGRRAAPAAVASCCCGWRRSEGCYVPSLYAVSYGADGAIAEVAPADPRVPRTVQKRTTVDLDAWPYPKTPLVPMAETVHERASVEIFRGCTRGCRFCQAGMITRPVRERSLRGIGEMVDAAVRASRVRRGRAAVAVQRGPLGDRRDHQGPGRPLRGHQHVAVAARPPGSTRSTSTSPTRSAATAAAPGSRSPRRAAPSGSGA